MCAIQLGFLNGIYGGLGQSTGALIGGSLKERYGTSTTFIIAGIVDVGILLLFVTYWLVHPGATKLED